MNKFLLFFFSILTLPLLLTAQQNPFDCRTTVGEGTLLCTQSTGAHLEVYNLDSMGVAHKTQLDQNGSILLQSNLGRLANDSVIVQGNQVLVKSAAGVVISQKTILASILALFDAPPSAAQFGDQSFLFSGIRSTNIGGVTTFYRVRVRTNSNLNLLSKNEQVIAGVIVSAKVEYSYRLSNGNIAVITTVHGMNLPDNFTSTDIQVYNSALQLVSNRRLDNQSPDALYRTPCGHLLVLGNYQYSLFHNSSFSGKSRFVVTVEQNKIISSFINGRLTRNYDGQYLVETFVSAAPDSVKSHWQVKTGTNPIPDLVFELPTQNVSMINQPYNHAIPTGAASVLLFGETNGEVWVLNPNCSLSKPDVRPTFAMTNPSSISNGDELQVLWSMNNIGAASAENFNFNVYLSDDDVVSADDVVLQTEYIQSLPAGQSTNGDATWKLPMLNSSTGLKKVLFVADPLNVLDESDEGNNLQSVSLQISLNQPISACVQPFAKGEFLCSQKANGVVTVYTKSNERLWQHTIQSDGTYTSSDFGLDRRDSLLVVGNNVVKKSAAGAILYTKEIPLSVRALIGATIKAAELSNGNLVLVGWKRQGQFNPTTSNLVAARVNSNMDLQQSVVLRSISHVGPLSGSMDEVITLINLPNDAVSVLYKYGTFGAQLGNQYNSGTYRIDANLAILHEQLLERENVTRVSLTPCNSYKMYSEFDAGDHIHTSFTGKKEHYMKIDTWLGVALRISGTGGNQVDGPFEQLDFYSSSPLPLESNLKWRSSFETLPDLEFRFQVSIGSVSDTFPYLPYIYAERYDIKRAFLFGYQNDSLWLFNPKCIDTPPSTCASNVLINPNFDQQLTGWNGAALLQVAPNHLTVCANYGAARQTRATQAGKSYTLTVDTYRDAGVTGVVGLKFLSNTWQVLQEDYMGINTAVFSSITTTKTAPTGAGYVEVSLVKTNGAAGCIHADNWCLDETSGGGCSPDVTPPTISCPANIVLTTSGTTAVAEWLTPYPEDNCAGNTYPTSSHQSGMAFLVGQHTVVYTAHDAAGNTGTCSFLISITQQGGSTCANNLLGNPDFENQNISGWSGGGIYAETNGQRYISVCTNGTTAHQTKPAEAGKEYTLKVKANRSSNTTQGVIGIKFLSNAWQVLASDYRGIFTETFNEVLLQKTAPANTAYIEISLIKTDGSGCVNADDWCLSTGGSTGGGTCSGNMLDNPSYAGGSNAQWQGNFTIGDDAQANIYWAQVCATGQYVYQTKAATAGQSFNFSAKTAYSNNTTQGILTIKFMSAGWSVLEQNYINIPSTTFTTVQKSVTAPANTAWVEVSAYKSGGTGCVMVYDWCLAQPNAPFVQGTAVPQPHPDTEVLIYPNPATNFMFLNLKDYAGKTVDIYLIDHFGKTVLSQLNQSVSLDNQQLSLDLMELFNGQYFVKIHSEGERPVVKKLVVVRMY